MKSKEYRIAEQNKLLRLLPEVRWRLRHITNVCHIGVGAKEKNGEVTDEFAFRVYVDKKAPSAALPSDKVIPSLIKNIPTDVIVHSKTEMLVDSSKARPLKGGFQIRNEFVRGKGEHLVGTLGCLAQVDNATQDLVGLSCEHVLMAGQANLRVNIGQPKYSVSCCCCVHGQIGAVINSQKDDKVDCGIIHLDEDIREEVTTAGTMNEIEGIISPIVGVAQAVCFEPVLKRGRTTELTTGEVIDIIYDGSQILIHPTGGSPKFADHGDSGSVIVNASDRVIGLLWATDAATRTKGVANHIGQVMQEMNILIAGQSNTGLALPGDTCPSSSGP
jgi:hypothetical protein